jgi:hypothetical protein
VVVFIYLFIYLFIYCFHTLLEGGLNNPPAFSPLLFSTVIARPVRREIFVEDVRRETEWLKGQ